MADMADFAIEHMLECEARFDRHRYADLQTQYEEGLIDEYGVDLHSNGQHKRAAVLAGPAAAAALASIN